MVVLRIVHESMIDTAIELRRAGEDIESERAGLVREAGSVLGGGWSGPAAQGFRSAFEEWDEGAVAVVRALERMGTLVESVTRDFAAGDAADAAAVARAAHVPGSSGLNL